MIKALLYGSIGYEVEARDVVEYLDAHKDEDVELHINSPGGSVFEAIAMRTAIMAHKRITLVVDAIAASAAAIISLCGKPLKMADYSRLMLHSASSYASGNKKQMQEEIAMLESIDNDLASMIADKFGKEKDEILATYFDGSDHWLDRDECIKMGLAEKYEPEGEAQNAHTAVVWDCINFKQAKMNNNNNKKQENMDLTKFQSVKAFMKCTTEEQIVDVATKMAAELEDAQTAIANKDKRIKELEDQINAFEAEKQKAQDNADEKVIADAVEAGKITSEQADIYRAMLKTDRENALKMLDTVKAQPEPKKVTDYIKGEGGNGEPKKSYFEEQMERIRKQNQ